MRKIRWSIKNAISDSVNAIVGANADDVIRAILVLVNKTITGIHGKVTTTVVVEVVAVVANKIFLSMFFQRGAIKSCVSTNANICSSKVCYHLFDHVQ